MHIAIQTAAVALAALLFTGCTPDTPVLPGDTSPAGVGEKLTGSDGPAFLTELSNHSWPDRGAQAAQLFDWIAADAGSANPDTAARAGRSAHAIAVHLADNNAGLKDLGTANPKLLQGFGAALIPFQGAMVGDASGTSGFTPLDDLRSNLPQTARVFAVIAGDETAGREFSAAARQRALDYQKAWAADPTTDDLQRAARLLGLVAAAARAAGHESTDLTYDHVVASARWIILAQTVHGSEPHIDPRYFNPDGSLMSPDQVAKQLGAGNWSLYNAALSNALAGNQPAWEAVQQFGRTFRAIANP